MRSVGNLDEWLVSRRQHTRLIAELAEESCSVRRRPRTGEEHQVLEQAALATIERSRAEGRIVKIGPRRYRIALRAPRA